MGKRKGEIWAKPRSRANHFNDSDRERIKACYLAGQSVFDTAKELKSSTRTIGLHFRQFSDAGLPRGGVPDKPVRAPANYTARLYKPNWDIV